MRPPALRIHTEELIVDNFAGGGGASLGIEWATGRSPDIAVNHDPEAIAMHKANHPETKHFCEDVWKVDPKVACGGRKVALAWFSPDCKHFSKAKGGKPVDKNIRGLAWVVTRWAKAVKPRVIILLKYYGTEQDPQLGLPLHTLTTKHRFALVMVDGWGYVIADIGMRMLIPRELFRAQGFGDEYLIEVPFHGKPLSKTAQVRMCGNSVNPDIAEALVVAQFAANAAGQEVA